jgi:hypothetical protein
MPHRALAALAVFSLAAPPARATWDDWCRVKEPRDATVDAAGADALRVIARAGSLRIVGERGLDRVVVSGRACASDRETLEAVRLLADKSGREVRVVAELPEHSWSFFGRSHSSMLDLEIRVPAGFATEVEDSSGDAEISGVASLRIKDSSGSLRIRDVAGEVRVRDGSGEIELQRAGSVLIDEDGSGSIDLLGVKGDVQIHDDGSGGISIRDVGGSVRIGDSGSGGVDVDNVRGDFVVRDNRSGGIHYTRVAGRVDVPEDRSAVRARERAERERERARERAERERERAQERAERARERAERERERARQRWERYR